MDWVERVGCAVVVTLTVVGLFLIFVAPIIWPPTITVVVGMMWSV